MRSRKIVGAVLVFALFALGCKPLSELRDGVRDLRLALKDASDVGLISELGWLSKTLRDSATGTPQEQARARADAAKLFGISEEELKGQSIFYITVKVEGLEPQKNNELQVDLRFPLTIEPNAISQEFKLGNWQGGMHMQPSLMTPPSMEKTEALVRERLTPYFPLTFNMGLYTVGAFRASAPGVNQGLVKPAAERLQRQLVDDLAEVILTPYKVTDFPTPGVLNGEWTQPWGLTQGGGPYAAVFVPQKEVGENDKIKIYAWLHLKGHPEIILGPGWRP